MFKWHIGHQPPRLWPYTAAAAKRLANQRRLEQQRCNQEHAQLDGLFEWLYSPDHFSYGIRNIGEPTDPIRIPNIYDPMYGCEENITYWVSVGTDKPPP